MKQPPEVEMSSDAGARPARCATSLKRKRNTRAGCRLPDHLIELSILPRLPAKSLSRLQCVSRQWHRITHDPYFIYLQSQSAPSGLLCTDSREEVLNGQFLAAAFVSRAQRSIGIPDLYRGGIKAPRRSVVASCSGLLYLVCGTDDGVRGSLKSYIGNPCLRDWRRIPNPPGMTDIYCKTFGLAVDVGESAVRYKAVVVSRRGEDTDVFQVFSSRSGRWEEERAIDAGRASHARFTGAGTYVRPRGALYWVRTDDRVLRFDSKDGRISFHPLPPRADHGRGDHPLGAVGEWNGELSYSRIVGRENKKIEIWSSMEDRAHGQLHWTKRHSLSFQRIFQGTVMHRPMWDVIMREEQAMPFEGGSVSFCTQGTLYTYDTATGAVQKHVESFVDGFWFSYKSSLVPSPILGPLHCLLAAHLSLLSM